MAGPIATLRVMLAADDAELRTALGRSDKASRKWAKAQEKRAEAVRRAFTRMSAVVAASTAAMIVKQTEFADNIQKTSQKLGLTVERYQQLAGVAALASINQRTFNMSIQRFARRVGEAAKGQGELVKDLKEANISLVDQNGNYKSTNQLLMEYGDYINSAGTAQERLRRAFKAFDSEGAAMVNMFKDGSEAVNEMAKGINTMAESKVDDVVASMDRLSFSFSQLKTTVMSSGTFTHITDSLAMIMNVSDAMIQQVSYDIDRAKITFSKLFSSIHAAMLNSGMSLIQGTQSIINGMIRARNLAPEWLKKLMGWSDEDRSTFGNEATRAMQLRLQTVRQEIERLNQQLADMPKQTVTDFLDKIVQGANTISIAGGTPTASADDTTKKKTTEETVNAAEERFNQYIKNLKSQQLELQNFMADSWKGVAGNFLSNLDKMGKAGKAFARMQVIYTTSRAIMTALADTGVTWPMRLANAAIAGAMGASQLGQFHDGIDSVPSTGSYLLESGERVIDKRTNRDLKDALKSGGMNGGNNMPATLNFNVTGVEDPEVINKVIQQNRGDFEAMLRQINADRAGAGLI
jgi:hypothetical protein